MHENERGRKEPFMKSNSIQYTVEQINDIITILDSISADTKSYSGLGLIIAISNINQILHSGEILENNNSLEDDNTAGEN